MRNVVLLFLYSLVLFMKPATSIYVCQIIFVCYFCPFLLFYPGLPCVSLNLTTNAYVCSMKNCCVGVFVLSSRKWPIKICIYLMKKCFFLSVFVLSCIVHETYYKYLCISNNLCLLFLLLFVFILSCPVFPLNLTTNVSACSMTN